MVILLEIIILCQRELDKLVWTDLDGHVITESNLLCIFYFFDIDFIDIDCAFKIIKTDLFKKIKVKTKDAFIDAEIMIRASLLGYSFTELGVKHLPRVDGVSTAARPSIIFRTIGEIISFKKEINKELRERRT